LKVLVVSGIWPPDSGGPASHAHALSGYLQARGHVVGVVTTAAAAPATEPYTVSWVARSLPRGIRHLVTTFRIARRAASSDVVYATSMVRRAAIGATLARRPLVVKLVSDEVFEREQREGRFRGTLEEFQRSRGGSRVAFLRRTRGWALGRATRVLCPSRYLRAVAIGWGLDAERLAVLTNPAPDVPPLPAREELRGDLGLAGNVLAFAGRLGPQKSLAIALDALASIPGVTLAIAGDGPERAALEERVRGLGLDSRVRFLGSLDRDRVLRLFRAADASLLSSSWENLPHTVVESLAVGTPVIATAVGGVPEIVRDGENGLLVPPNDAGALGDAIRRFFTDGGLRARLAEHAPSSVAGSTEEAVFSEIEHVLGQAAR
jgi:glycosyltransferase involved in cell wall biosynthesis